MLTDFDYAQLENELATVLTADQRQWLAILLHDHVSGLFSTIALHTELLHRMLARDADITEEFALFRQDVRAAADHIHALQESLRKAC